MHKKHAYIKYLLTAVFLMVSMPGYADWSSCESELSRIKREARDAESTASDLDSLEDDLEYERNEYEDCLQFPDVYDLYGDGCESQRSDYNWKVNEYNSKISDMDSDINNLIRRVKRALSDLNFFL